jgi:hypothetical protein
MVMGPGWAVLASFALLAASCSPEPVVDEGGAAGSDTPVVGRWTAESTLGTEVRLEGPAGPLEAGTIHFVALVDPPPAGPSLSVDLVSPTMPMHGIQRFPVRRQAPGEYLIEVPIPMEGLWSLYVNLDEGSDAAEFSFEVEPGVGAEGHGEHH